MHSPYQTNAKSYRWFSLLTYFRCLKHVGDVMNSSKLYVIVCYVTGPGCFFGLNESSTAERQHLVTPLNRLFNMNRMILNFVRIVVFILTIDYYRSSVSVREGFCIWQPVSEPHWFLPWGPLISPSSSQQMMKQPPPPLLLPLSWLFNSHWHREECQAILWSRILWPEPQIEKRPGRRAHCRVDQQPFWTLKMPTSPDGDLGTWGGLGGWTTFCLSLNECVYAD